jgi:hypothetical protein
MKALLVRGGWPGHDPEGMAAFYREGLEAAGARVTVADELSVLADRRRTRGVGLVVMIWSMGTIDRAASEGLRKLVHDGAGLAGAHGGIVDAFRSDVQYQRMVGGQFVGHPEGWTEYWVRVTDRSHPATRGLPKRFRYASEQYFVQWDPTIRILAETTHSLPEGRVSVPVAWTKRWGRGRVFVSTLGHNAAELRSEPYGGALALNGACWAARMRVRSG